MSMKPSKARVLSKEADFAMLLIKKMTAWNTNLIIPRYGADLRIVASSPKVGTASKKSP